MTKEEGKAMKEQEGEIEGTEDPKETEGRAPRRAVSLAWEVATIQDAIGATRVLADALRAGTLADEEEEKHAMLGLSATLSLVWCRLRDLGKVAGGFLDPAVLLAPHNEAIRVDGEVEAREVKLRPWTRRRRKRHLQEELAHVQAQIDAEPAGNKDHPRGP